jgi:hypothetical protein
MFFWNPCRFHDAEWENGGDAWVEKRYTSAVFQKS